MKKFICGSIITKLGCDILYEQTLNIDDVQNAAALFGTFDENVKMLQNAFGVTIVVRDSEIKITGSQADVALAVRSIDGMLMMLSKGETLDSQKVNYVISLVSEGSADKLNQIAGDCVCITTKGRPVKAKTLGQKKYIDSIKENTITFGIGPAGTGKTYLAVAMAVKSFKNREVTRIILTRPAVEAGEKLGFLPGDLQSKIDPYLRPLYDALFDMLGQESFHLNQQKGLIEVAPLAYMRGRTLDDSFIILDEAQNTTREQMKMFLTRLGVNSKMVITGDVTQIDLPSGQRSGLGEAAKILKNVEGIKTVRFSEKDVVRHRLVMDIIKAYETIDKGNKGNER